MIFFRLGMIFLALFSSMSFGMCDPNELVIKFSHVSAASGHPKGDAAAAIAARINREMDGKACMEVYPKSQLFNDSDVFQALILGDVHVAAPSLSKFEAYTKRLRIFDLPFLFENTESVDRFVHGSYGQELLNIASSKGIVGLTYIYGGFKQFSANKPLLKPADAKGLSFRANSSDVTVSMMEALQAKGVKLPFKEVYPALETGIVDGQDNSWANIYKAKIYEVQHSVTETNHKILTYMGIVSAAWLNNLPEDIRTQFVSIFTEESRLANQRVSQTELSAKKSIAEQGIVINQLTNQQREEWRAAMKPVWDKYASSIGQDVIEAAIASNRQ